MKKILLVLGALTIAAINAQNYYGTQFIGESGTNNPTSFSKNGNIITLSSFIGGNLTGSFPITFLGGNADGVLTKLNQTDGTIEWIKQFGGGGDEVVIDTTIDAAGNYYITGYMTGAGSLALDADPGTAVFPLPVTSLLANRDIFIVKLDAAGNFVWGKSMCSPSGAGNDDVSTIKLDSQGNILLAGSFVFIDFDPGSGTQTYTSVGNSDSFIVKLTNNGDFVWVKILSGTSNKKIMDMELDANDNIYVAGRFQGTIDLDPDAVATDTKTTAGNFDTFLAKYNSSGNYVWGNSYGSTAADKPEKILVNGNNVFVSGSFTGTVDLDPSTTGTNSVTAAAGQDAYLSKFSIDGVYSSSFVIPGTTTNLDVVRDIYIDQNTNNIYISGLFQSITLNSSVFNSVDANADAFYLKLNSDMTYSSIYLIQGALAQSVPLIMQLSTTKFIAAGASKSNADYDYTSNTSTEVPSNALTYTYITKFDFETTTMGVDDILLNNSLKIFPNPTKSDVNFITNTSINGVYIYNLDGKLVFSQNRSNIEKINISILPQGTYILQTVDEKGKKLQTKLIKK